MGKNVISLVMILIIIAVTGCSSKSSNEITVSAEASIKPNYENLEELEEESELVVIGNKIDETPYLFGENDLENPENTVDLLAKDIANFYTLSTFKVTKIIKSNNSVEKNDEITILENAAKTKDGYLSVEDYQLMDNDKKYVLFLRKSETDDCYIIKGVFLGKYSLDQDDIKYMEKEEKKNLKGLKKLYHQIYKEVIKTYGSLE